jgi:hypothetical protein
MRSTLGYALHEAPAGAADTATAAKEIPYDHVVKFALLGQRGNRVQDVVNISIEGAFVAVAIGYSFVPAALTLPDPPPPLARTAPRATEAMANWILQAIEAEPLLASSVTQALLVKWCGIDFNYSIVDSGSGRELQNRPIHNIAGLGEATGERPFRPLAKPMLFMPRSTIRVEIEEISAGPLYAGAQLYIVLHGYKILGYGTR